MRKYVITSLAILLSLLSAFAVSSRPGHDGNSGYLFTQQPVAYLLVVAAVSAFSVIPSGVQLSPRLLNQTTGLPPAHI